MSKKAVPEASPPPKSVLELVRRFAQHQETYKQQGYNETQVRREFIDPLFKALGWDVGNHAGHAEAYKDVIHEDAIKVGGSTKAPDYCFRIGGVRKFFVEAKRPSIAVKDDPSPAYQLRRYAWTAKLPLAIVTDFEEFAVYDCRIRPRPTDKPSTARVKYITCDEYADRWDEIASIFAKEAILQGSFDKYAESTKRKRGTAEVDTEFLKEIERWRELLARNIALRNGGLSVRDLNYAVSKTIDRLIFLRMCEDRGVETYAQLRTLLNGAKVYDRLGTIFRSADDRYNSGLFHFQREKGRPDSPDELTPGLTIDDGPLKDIIKGLYYPECPYEFSVLPAEILGQVYEQFLGKVIRLTKGHRAVVEEKPEVKKAGGVYYTPTYIVDYIVEHTVGKLLEGAAVKWIGTEKRKKVNQPRLDRPLRILDPACGSGSFLLGAYGYLLRWHLDYYTANDPEAWATRPSPPIHESSSPQSTTGGGQSSYRLSITERKRILVEHIYGVDIDPQAVEVTKLSLLLKVLEGESQQTLDNQLRLFHERALPDLGSNIKCGNSLIGPDFYDNQQLDMFDEEERYRINVFDWETEFADIMNAGRFDAVIGNPPYGALFAPEEQAYVRQRFEAHSSGLDSYVLFMQRALELAGIGGLVSYIVPTGWYTGADFPSIRRYLGCASDPVGFVNLPYDVFRAWVDTTVFVTKKRASVLDWPRTEPCELHLRTFPKRHRIVTADEMTEALVQADLTSWFADGADEYLTFASAREMAIIRKMQMVGKPLSDYADVQRGVTPLKTTEKLTHATSRRAFKGTVRRYKFDPGPKVYVRFDHTIAEPKPEKYFKGPRLLLRELISRQFQLQAVSVAGEFVTNKSMQSILRLPDAPDLNYLLALINSRLMSWYFLRKSSIAQRDDFPKIVLKESRALPIPPVNLGKADDTMSHDRMVALVQQMLDLHKQLSTAKTPTDKTAIQRQIDATDKRIDKLVYELYGLTEDEIRIVEEATQ